MVIDFHSHNFPEALAARAIESMSARLVDFCSAAGTQYRPAGDGTVATQLRHMDAAGVDVCVNCPVATRPEQFDAIFSRALALRSGEAGAAVAERIVQLGSVHPRDPRFAERVRTLKEAGFPGIKLHPNYQGISLDDPSLVPFFAALRDAGMFVISHCGFDPGFLDAPDVASPAQIAKLLTAVPGLKFVAGHLGGECGGRPHDTDALMPFESCWIDTAVMFHHNDDPEARRVVREWPADRMVFGTDYFWRDEAEIRAWVESARPSAADRELIFHRNAERLLGIAQED